MTRRSIKTILTIAGTDPSGGAGIQADIKAISATGAYAASVITAVVAQNTMGVQDIHTIPAEMVTAQLDAVFSDLDIHAIKIGMVHDKLLIESIVYALEEHSTAHVVIDPVMVAKNGCPLLKPEQIVTLKTQLLPLATLITPNLPEAEALLGYPIKTQAGMEDAAKALSQQFDCSTLLKGGHFESDTASDVLYQQDTDSLHWLHANRIQTKNTHGTGCSLSSAIASYLGQGYTLKPAIEAAKTYLTLAITSGSQLTIGQGHGPVDHFYFLDSQ